MFGSRSVRFTPRLEPLDERANPGGSWGTVGGSDGFLLGGSKPSIVVGLGHDEVGPLGSKPSIIKSSGLGGDEVGLLGGPDVVPHGADVLGGSSGGIEF